MVTVKHLTFQANLPNKQITFKKKKILFNGSDIRAVRKEPLVGSLSAEMFISNAIWRKRHSVKWRHPLGTKFIYI